MGFRSRQEAITVSEGLRNRVRERYGEAASSAKGGDEGAGCGRSPCCGTGS